MIKRGLPLVFIVSALVLGACTATNSTGTPPGTTGGNGTNGSTPGTAPAVLLVRKNAKDLTATEKADFVKAVRTLQTTPSPVDPSMTWYDQFVYWHREAFACALARGPAGAAHNSILFLPWHRDFLLRFEAALQKVSGNPKMTIPYWDWTDDASTKAVFADDLMGGEGDPAQGYAVTTGAFAKGKYTLNILDPKSVQDQIAPQTDYLVRRFGVLGSGTQALPTKADVDAALAAPNLDVPGWDAQADPSQSFRNNIEGWRQATPPTCDDEWQNQSQTKGSPHDMHNGGHVWVGSIWTDPDGSAHAGTMVYNTSLDDPVFWLHHANIDRLYDAWQVKHNNFEFPADAAGYTSASQMWPWMDRAIGTLDRTAVLGYKYE